MSHCYTPSMLAALRHPIPAMALCVLASLAAGACGSREGPATIEGPRNFLLIILDTTRADHLRCYGYERDTTPILDELAGNGVRFASTYSQSSLTPVSAASFLTGTYPFRTGIRSLFIVEEQTMSRGVTSLFELLSATGRQTAGFVSARPMGEMYGFGRGFDLYDDAFKETAKRYGIERFSESPQRPGDETTDLALAWLHENGSEPFAAMVHYFDAHDLSFVPPREFLEDQVSFPLPPDLGRKTSIHVDAEKDLYLKTRRVELYDAEIRYMDLQVGRLLEELERIGVRDETLICVVADHGEAFGEHDFWTHGLLYGEQLRVPWILSGSDLPANRVVEERVRLVDLAPTLAEVFRLRTRSGLDGVSLLPLIRGEGDWSEPLDVYAEVHHAPGDPRRRAPAIQSLTVGDFKLVTYPKGDFQGHPAEQFFHLGEDAGEQDDRSAEDHPMQRSLRRVLTELGRPAADIDLEAISAEQRAQMRELGYLGGSE